MASDREPLPRAQGPHVLAAAADHHHASRHHQTLVSPLGGEVVVQLRQHYRPGATAHASHATVDQAPKHLADVRDDTRLDAFGRLGEDQ